jgi:hypothetical protein
VLVSVSFLWSMSFELVPYNLTLLWVGSLFCRVFRISTLLAFQSSVKSYSMPRSFELFLHSRLSFDLFIQPPGQVRSKLLGNYLSPMIRHSFIEHFLLEHPWSILDQALFH